MLKICKEKFYNHILILQEQVIASLKSVDPEGVLTADNWIRKDSRGEDGGGGKTRAFTGNIIEKAGVNTSLIYGHIEEDFASTIGTSNPQLWGTGVSIIIHPHSPRIPTVHANFRMIHSGDKFWFGGGADLTPYYPYEEDFHHFHRVWQKACAAYGTYPQWSQTCNEYFVNKHRSREKRGIGGIFFDHINSGTLEKDFEMVVDVSKSFIESYFPLVWKRKDTPFDEDDREFQLHRRGRYVEFNLLHDRGTAFGLKTKGRVESILISLPNICKFTYDYKPRPNSPHEKMMDYYINRHSWGDHCS